MSGTAVLGFGVSGYVCMICDVRDPPWSSGVWVYDSRCPNPPMPVDCIAKVVLLLGGDGYSWGMLSVVRLPCGWGVDGWGYRLPSYLLTFQSVLFLLPSCLLLASCLSLLFSLVALIKGIMVLIRR